MWIALRKLLPRSRRTSFFAALAILLLPWLLALLAFWYVRESRRTLTENRWNAIYYGAPDRMGFGKSQLAILDKLETFSIISKPVLVDAKNFWIETNSSHLSINFLAWDQREVAGIAVQSGTRRFEYLFTEEDMLELAATARGGKDIAFQALVLPEEDQVAVLTSGQACDLFLLDKSRKILAGPVLVELLDLREWRRSQAEED